MKWHERPTSLSSILPPCHALKQWRRVGAALRAYWRCAKGRQCSAREYSFEHLQFRTQNARSEKCWGRAPTYMQIMDDHRGIGIWLLGEIVAE